MHNFIGVGMLCTIAVLAFHTFTLHMELQGRSLLPGPANTLTPVQQVTHRTSTVQTQDEAVAFAQGAALMSSLPVVVEGFLTQSANLVKALEVRVASTEEAVSSVQRAAAAAPALRSSSSIVAAPPAAPLVAAAAPVPVYTPPLPSPPVSMPAAAATTARPKDVAANAFIAKWVAKSKAIYDPSDSSGIAKRYVVYKGAGGAGWGNWWYGLTSTFMFALLTDRALAIEHWDSRFGQYWSMPNFEIHEGKMVYDKSSNAHSKVHITYNAGKGEDYMKSYEKLGCEDLNIAFPEATVEIASEQNLLLFFATNPHYEAMIQATFDMSGMQIFRPLMRHLLKLAPGMRTKLDTIFSKKKPGALVIGMHVRKTDNAPIGPQGETEFFRCARAIAAQQDPDVPVQFYIASDAADVIGHAKQQLGEENLIFNSGIATGNAAAVLEAWGLAECDEIIASASSTFSGTSHGLAGIIPHQIMLRQPMCVQMVTPIPCAHQWPEMSPAHESNAKRNLRCHNHNKVPLPFIELNQIPGGTCYF